MKKIENKTVHTLGVHHTGCEYLRQNLFTCIKIKGKKKKDGRKKIYTAQYSTICEDSQQAVSVNHWPFLCIFLPAQYGTLNRPVHFSS